MHIQCALQRDNLYIPSKLLTGDQTEPCVECGAIAWHERMVLSPKSFGWAHLGCTIPGTQTA